MESILKDIKKFSIQLGGEEKETNTSTSEEPSVSKDLRFLCLFIFD
jgi:hypothetical protein